MILLKIIQSELQKHGQRHVKIQIEQRCRISQKNKHLEQKFLILSGLWKNRQECGHSGGKKEKQRSFHDRSTWEREVLQKGTYVQE